MPERVLSPRAFARFRAGGLAAAVVILAAVGVLGAQELWYSAQHADEKLTLAGIGNFGRMNPRLYRGAQPTDAGFAALKTLGIETVVRFSLGEEGAAAEGREVTALGMRFVDLPWSVESTPTRDEVRTFLTLLRDHPAERVFVHCKAGADRTGVMVAVSRIALDHWTPAAAIDEMRAFHYQPLFHPQLQAFVERFAAGWTSQRDDAAFFASAPPAGTP